MSLKTISDEISIRLKLSKYLKTKSVAGFCKQDYPHNIIFPVSNSKSKAFQLVFHIFILNMKLVCYGSQNNGPKRCIQPNP